MIKKKNLLLLSISITSTLLGSLFYSSITLSREEEKATPVDIINLPIDEEGNLKVRLVDDEVWQVIAELQSRLDSLNSSYLDLQDTVDTLNESIQTLDCRLPYSICVQSFRYYNVSWPILGPANYDHSIPARNNTVFGVVLTNLDPFQREVNLTEHSLFYLVVPTKNAMLRWEITKVVNETLVPFDYQILEWGTPTLVYFGPSSASQLAGNPAACNILLYGTMGDEDYGQNIPFVSLYLHR